jgi:hypothetical protein
MLIDYVKGIIEFGILTEVITKDPFQGKKLIGDLAESYSCRLAIKIESFTEYYIAKIGLTILNEPPLIMAIKGYDQP